MRERKIYKKHQNTTTTYQLRPLAGTMHLITDLWKTLNNTYQNDGFETCRLLQSYERLEFSRNKNSFMNWSVAERVHSNGLMVRSHCFSSALASDSNHQAINEIFNVGTCSASKQAVRHYTIGVMCANNLEGKGMERIVNTDPMMTTFMVFYDYQIDMLPKQWLVCEW